MSQPAAKELAGKILQDVGGIRELARLAGFSNLRRLEIESPVQQFFVVRNEDRR